MSITHDASSAGFRFVKTLAGAIPIEQWTRRDELGMTFDPAAGKFYGPWRAASTLELMAFEDQIGAESPLLGMQSRDVWELES